MAEIDEIAHAIAGAGGGALSMIVTYPLVTLSTVAQTERKQKNEESELEPVEGAKEYHCKIIKKILESSTYRTAKRIIEEHGVLGLYKGLESAIYGITLNNFIYYYFYELTTNVFLRSNLTSGQRGLTTVQSMITGAIAGSLTCIGGNPFWVANTRMMTAKKRGEDQGKTYSGSAFKTIYHIAQNEGIGSLFAGVLPALVLVINPIIQYTVFEQIKNFIIAKNGRRSFTAGKAFFIGAFGKLIATFLTYPYITLKSRMHVKGKKGKGEESDEPKLSMVSEIRKILREEGIEGLYGGLTVKLVQSISTAAFLFYFKEELLTGSVKLVQILKLLKAKKELKH